MKTRVSHRNWDIEANEKSTQQEPTKNALIWAQAVITYSWKWISREEA